MREEELFLLKIQKNHEQSFKSGSTAYFGNRSETVGPNGGST